jgi:hypothetical protein
MLFTKLKNIESNLQTDFVNKMNPKFENLKKKQPDSMSID